MKHHILPVAIATIITSYAGTPAPEIATPAPEPEPWIKPILDIRARYEYGNVNAPGLGDATAFTTRERVGLLTRDIHGFSALVEGEFLQALDNHYDSGPGASTRPNNPTLTQIADPRTNELNQAYLQYKGFDTMLRGGRQRIKLDNDAFIGNVGWRQNEQTYDGISLTNNSIDDLTLFYSYVNRANRIFGSEATGALRNFAGDVHLFNASYKGCGDATITAYAYLMDFDKTAANAGYISNNTYGGYVTKPIGPVTLYGELAYQTDASSSPPIKPNKSWYSHIKASAKAGDHTFTLGHEYLDADFVTPLATVHAFNGFADVLIGPRIGLVRNPGISDLYVSHATPLSFWGLKFSQFFHLMGDNNSNFDYGWEYDAVLAKKFSENFLAIAKFAYFDSDGVPTSPGAVNPAPFDTTRFTIELNYKF